MGKSTKELRLDTFEIAISNNKLPLLMRKSLLIIFLAMFSFTACQPENKSAHNKIDSVAELYVKLQLVIGQYDAYYVDAYYGPKEWEPAEITDKEKAQFPAGTLLQQVDQLIGDLNSIDVGLLDNVWQQRQKFLIKHLASTRAKIELLSGVSMTFDEESQRLYDVVAPSNDLSELRKELVEVKKRLTGEGDVFSLSAEIQQQFIVPDEKLDTLIQVTISELRKRTAGFIELAESDSIRVELVNDKPWGAYNWYQGNAQSLIQLNTDRPMYVNQLISFLSHEIYPGHHLHLSTLDVEYAQNLGWVEFMVYPLYSPLSLIAEGIAESAGSIIFTEAEQIQFEKDVLMPLAGIDTNGYFRYTQTEKQISRITDLIQLEISRSYADGMVNRVEAVKMLQDELDYTNARAHQALDFVDAYGSYIINYSVGKEIIGNYIENKRQGDNTAENNWNVFEQIITTPIVPSDLLVTN